MTDHTFSMKEALATFKLHGLTRDCQTCHHKDYTFRQRFMFYYPEKHPNPRDQPPFNLTIECEGGCTLVHGTRIRLIASTYHGAGIPFVERPMRQPQQDPILWRWVKRNKPFTYGAKIISRDNSIIHYAILRFQHPDARAIRWMFANSYQIRTKKDQEELDEALKKALEKEGWQWMIYDADQKALLEVMQASKRKNAHRVQTEIMKAVRKRVKKELAHRAEPQ